MRKINKAKRGIAFVLIMMVFFSNQVQAMDIVGQSGSNQENNTFISPNNEQTKEDNTVIEEPSEKTESSKLELEQPNEEKDITEVNYIYVESPYISGAQTQNIAISWGDGTQEVENVQLVLLKGNGQEKRWECTKRVGELFLFSKSFLENETDTYDVISFHYFSGGAEKVVSLEDGDNVAGFGVNVEYSTNSSTVEKSQDEIVSNVIKVNPDGSYTQSESLEAAIEAVAGETIVQGATKARSGSPKVVVALDPGHDSTHAGASANGLREEVLTLKIAQYCKTELESYGGVSVYMTRTGASCPYPGTGSSGACIRKRVEAAAKQGARILVSFHLNSSTSTSANGAEVIIPNKSWKPDQNVQGQKLAELILQELSELGLAKRQIYFKNATDGDQYQDGSIGDYFAVQNAGKDNDLPGIIVEHAFITNSSNVNNYLGSDDKLQKLGVADATGIAKYLNIGKTGWQYDGTGWKYLNEEHNYVTEGWLFVNNQWYFFKNSYMQVGWLYTEIQTYYFDPVGGAMATGWQRINNTTYYFGISGNLYKGVQNIGGETYYFNTTTGALPDVGWHYEGGKYYFYDKYGKMLTGWQYLGVSWYYMDPNGVLLTGWQTINGNTYYLGAANSGAMSIGWREIEGAKYYFNSSGILLRGTQKIDGITYYLDEKTGALHTSGWNFINGKYYYYTAQGKMLTGWQWLGTNWYYMDQNGVMLTGWQKINGYQYYLGPSNSGAMVTGWKTIDGGKYYFNIYGIQLTGRQIIDGVVYYLDDVTGILPAFGWNYIGGKYYYYTNQGKKLTGWQYMGTNWYYMDGNGVLLTGWQKINGYQYYLGPSNSGAMVTGWQTIDGGKYYFNIYGIQLTGKQTIDGVVYYLDEITGILPSFGWNYIGGKYYYYTNQGKKLSGWQYLGTNWYYMDGNGVLLTGWQIINGYQYYLGPVNSGAMVIGWKDIGGSKYYFDIYGMMKTDWQIIDDIWYYFGSNGKWISDTSTVVYSIQGAPHTTVDQMVKYYQKYRMDFPSDKLKQGGVSNIREFCQIYYEEACSEGISPEIPFTQSMKETNWLRFGGQVKIEQFNFAGLGATDGGSAGADFSIYNEQGVRMGIRAQIQHLKAYASSQITEKTLKYPCVDPRFYLVKKGSAPYVEWLGQKENPQGAGWATAENYGIDIVKMIFILRSC